MRISPHTPFRVGRLHDRNLLVRFERGTKLWLLPPHPHHRFHEITNLGQCPLLSEHIHVLRTRTELESHVALGVFEHDAVIPAHLSAQHFDWSELTGRTAVLATIEHFFHAVEVHLVLKRDAHFVKHAAHTDDVMVFINHTTNHCIAIQTKVRIHAGLFLELLEAFIRRTVDGDLNGAVTKLAEPATGHVVVLRVRVPRLYSDPDEVLHLVPDRIRVTRASVRKCGTSRPERRPAVDVTSLFLFGIVPGPVHSVEDLVVADGKEVFATPHDLIFALVRELKDARRVTEPDVVSATIHQVSVGLLDTNGEVIHLVDKGAIRHKRRPERFHVTV